jgi:hypothetical protein
VAGGTTCRASAGACDVAEACTGASGSCPPDLVAAPGVVCRDAVGSCDVAEECDGSGGSCPPNAIAPDGTYCDELCGEESCSGGVCRGGRTCSGGNVCICDYGCLPRGSYCP